MEKGLPTIPQTAIRDIFDSLSRRDLSSCDSYGRYLKEADICLCRSHFTLDAAKNTVDEEGTHAIPPSPRSGYVMNGTKGEWGTFMGRDS